MGTIRHDELTGIDNHPIWAFQYADETARLAATGFVVADTGKVARQDSDETFWVLTSEDPITWKSLDSAGGSVPIQSTFLDVAQNDELIINHVADVLNLRMVSVQEKVPGSLGVTQSNLDFDTADEADFIQEDAVDGTDFVDGVVTLHNAGGSGGPNPTEVTQFIENPTALAQYEQFGKAIATNSTHTLVGAPQTNDAEGLKSGKAYLFNTSTGALVHTFDNPSTFTTGTPTTQHKDFNFGGAVAMNEDYIVIAAPKEDNPADLSGSVYIFSATNFSLLHDIPNPFPAYNDTFGISVAINGTKVLVGCKGYDAAASGQGRAYVFDATDASTLHTFENPTPTTSAGFGGAVAMSGTHIVIGAMLGLADYPGVAYVFDATTYGLVHTLNNPNLYDTPNTDYFGSAVAISDSYVAVAARGEDAVDGAASGAVYVFNLTTGALLQSIANPNPIGTSQSDTFGGNVILSDAKLVVGSVEDSLASASGTVYVFNPATAELLMTINDPNHYGTGQDDNFGSSLAFTSNGLAVGAYMEGSTTMAYVGSVYVLIFVEPTNYVPGPFYVTTSDANQVNLGVMDVINSVTITDVQPAGTSVGVLISLDGRNSWLHWDTGSGAFVEHTGGVANKADWSSITNTELGLNAYDVTSETTLDFAFLLASTDINETPSIDLITINYDEEGIYKLVGLDAFEISYDASTQTKITKLLASASESVKVNILI